MEPKTPDSDQEQPVLDETVIASGKRSRRTSTGDDGTLNRRLRTSGSAVTPLLMSRTTTPDEGDVFALQQQVDQLRLESSRLKEQHDQLKALNLSLQERSKRERQLPQDNLSKAQRHFVSRPLKPKHFGLPTWDPTEDIVHHIQHVMDIVPEARQMTTESNICRILIQTLPPDYHFIRNLVDQTKYARFEAFAQEIARYLSDRREEQMEKFFICKKLPEEHLLGYFSRIISLYATANLLFGSDWMTESSHVMPIYYKFTESLNNESRLDLTRRVEEVENITVQKLKELIVRARPSPKQLTVSETTLNDVSPSKLDVIQDFDHADESEDIDYEESTIHSDEEKLIIDE